MKRCLRLFLLCAIATMLTVISGCSATEDDDKEQTFVSTQGATLLFQDTVSPNEEYIGSVIDIVYYNVEVYQNSDNLIIVNADSNSDSFERAQYTLSSNERMSTGNIDVEWQTSTGGTEPTNDDRLAVALVTIRSSEGIISQRKINYKINDIEPVVDDVN